MYSITIETVGNPDRQQFVSITDPCTITADSFEELRQKVRDYQMNEHIGSGNWTDPYLWHNDTVLGCMSFNGRVWPSDSRGKAKAVFDEVVIA